MFRQIYLVIIISVLIQGELFSQSDRKKPVNNWWSQSSLVDSTDDFLIHAAGKYSFTKKKGVISGVTHSGNILLVIRKGIITNFSNYGIDKIDLNIKSPINMDYITTSHYFTDYIDVDLSKSVFGEAGFIWERDDMLLIKNRYSVYAGAGMNFRFFGKLKVKSLVAMGRIDQDYMVPVDNLDVVKKPYMAFYCINKCEYAITPYLLFLGQVFYFTDIDEKERYRYGYNLNLLVGITRHINLVIGYNYNYDRELVRMGLTPDYSMQNIGVEVSL